MRVDRRVPFVSTRVGTVIFGDNEAGSLIFLHLIGKNHLAASIITNNIPPAVFFFFKKCIFEGNSTKAANGKNTQTHTRNVRYSLNYSKRPTTSGKSSME